MSVKSERAAQQRDRVQRSDNGKYRGRENTGGIDMHNLCAIGGFVEGLLETFVGLIV